MRDGVTATLASAPPTQVKSRDASHHAAASSGDSAAGGSTTVAPSCPRIVASPSARGRRWPPAAPAMRTITAPLRRQLQRVGIRRRAADAVERPPARRRGRRRRPAASAARAGVGNTLKVSSTKTPKPAETAEQQMVQVEAGGVLDDLAAAADQAAFAVDEPGADEEIAHPAVVVAARPVQARRHGAADGRAAADERRLEGQRLPVLARGGARSRRPACRRAP